MLAELVELVIGVHTHADTHTAAVLATDTGRSAGYCQGERDEDGYRELVALAEAHGGPRGPRWARTGSGADVRSLLVEAAVPGPDVMVDVLLAPLAAEVSRYERASGVTLAQVADALAHLTRRGLSGT